MSPLLRRLSGTRRRSVVRELEHALEVAETDRDIARAEKASAYEALGKVAAAAGRPGAPTRWNVEDLVDWATAARKAATSRLTGRLADAARSTAGRRELMQQLADETGRAETLADQRDSAIDDVERLSGELLAVDEALVAAGVDWTDDRATGIRDLADRRAQDAHKHFGQAADALVDVLGLTSCVRDGCGHARHQHGEAGECRGVLAGTRGAPCRCEAFDDGVVDATIACGVTPGGTVPPGHLPVCALPDGHHGDHEFAADPWCSADLDGARCARPAGHVEPCRPIAEGL